jgi:hypothetical protein
MYLYFSSRSLLLYLHVSGPICLRVFVFAGPTVMLADEDVDTRPTIDENPNPSRFSVCFSSCVYVFLMWWFMLCDAEKEDTLPKKGSYDRARCKI